MARAPRGIAERAKISISVIIHETEDKEGMVAAMKEMLGAKKTDAKEQSLAGHFGNRIVSWRATVSGPESAVALRTVRAALGWKSREEALREVGEIVDGKSVSLRLDKQDLVRRCATRSWGGDRAGGEAIVRISAPVQRGQDAAGVFADLLCLTA